jgi:hypothetical protein
MFRLSRFKGLPTINNSRFFSKSDGYPPPEQVKFGPLNANEIKKILPANKSDYPIPEPEPWSSDEVVERYSREDLQFSIKKWEEQHQAIDNEQGNNGPRIK